ncbi:MAG: hypothetical protein IJ074_08800, partial [Clostridia bacterium]|nr:hypothetical protein [Clostridia bacterium]
QTMNLRTDFVANASHELRSPLTSVRGYAELLEEEIAASPEERALCLHTIRSECDRMLCVIEDILRLSKAEREEAAPSTRLEIAPVANEVRQALLPRAAKKDITIEVNGQLSLFIQEKDIWEILYNLMDNAVRYGKKGGFVRVALTNNMIKVEDDGIGIEEGHLLHIFEPFYRVDEARDSDAGGTGLGLSIVRTIVERYEGVIRVESVWGSGTRFFIAFTTEK